MQHTSAPLLRRTALKGIGGLVLGLHLPGGSAKAQSSAAQILRADGTVAGFAPNAFVPLGADDTVTVLIKHIEFGQGPFTGLSIRRSRRQAAHAGEPTAQEPDQIPTDRARRRVKKLDAPAKTNGTAHLTIDIREPSLVTVVARPPRFGGKVASFDAGDARGVPGVVDVKQIPSGVAVYADNMWPALKGREKLKINWDESAAEKRSSKQLIEEYRS